nr:HEPN-associated N-terminal domain-containing protein [Glutamicibacter nicotianae]
MSSLVTAVAEAVVFRYSTPEQENVPYDSREGGWVGAPIFETDEVLMELCEDAIDGEYLWDFIQLIGSALDSTLWTPSRHVDSLDSMQWAWEQFEEDVKKSSRFVFFENEFDEDSSSATRSSAFLMKLQAYLDPDHGLITTIPAGTDFFRGRLIDNPYNKEFLAKISDSKGLGPAPAKKAAANRMSPRGIPMFYASAAPETAIKEIAAHGLYNYARIGTFKNQRPLKVLDLTSVPRRPSPFDMENRSKDGLLEFFRDFGRNVTQPVIPDGREHIDYVPTQVVTEFFRWAPEQELDGIKLKSAQDGEDTFVLFFSEEDVADEGRSQKTSPHIELDDPPTFTLDPRTVKTYEVKRRLDVSDWESGLSS